MAELIVNVQRVNKVETHPNADRLDLATVLGWQCVVGRDSVKEGDYVVYMPIDSVLPQRLEEILFSDSKIKLHNSRIKTVRIRGAVSQGLAVPYFKLADHYPGLKPRVGFDAKEVLGITKWEPKEPAPFTTTGGRQRSKKQVNPNFRKYTSIQHLRNYPDAVAGDETVVITEKIHGTNFRAGYVPIHAETWYGRLWKWARSHIDRRNFRHPGYEFVYGSHNVQLQELTSRNRRVRGGNFGHKKNVYAQMANAYGLRDVLGPGEVVYGEVYGEGIQKGYNYGLVGEIRLAVFDVVKDGGYMDFFPMFAFCAKKRLPVVPLLCVGRLSRLESVDHYAGGQSELCPSQKTREGCVMRTAVESIGHMGRRIFKAINPEYLLRRNNSDWH